MLYILKNRQPKMRSSLIEQFRYFILALLSFCSVLVLSYYHHWLYAIGLAVILSSLYAICRYEFHTDNDAKQERLETRATDIGAEITLYKDAHRKNSESLYYLIHHIIIDLEPRGFSELTTDTTHPLLHCLFKMCDLMLPVRESSPTALKPDEYYFLYTMMDFGFSLYFANIATPVEGLAKFKASVDRWRGDDEALTIFPNVLAIINSVANRNNISLTEVQHCV